MHFRLKPGHKAMLAIAAIVLAGGAAVIVISMLDSAPPRDLIGSTRLADAKSPGKHARATAPGPIARKGALAGRLIVKPASVTPGERIGVAVRNLGDEALSYGLELHVERRSGDAWTSAKEAVYGPGPVAVPLVLFSVPPGDTAGAHHNGGTFDGVTLPGKLEPGRYRFLKTVSGTSQSGDHPDLELTAGFRVRRPDVSPDQGFAGDLMVAHNGLDRTTLAAAQRDAQYTLFVPDDPAANLENMTGVFDDRSGTTLTLEFPPPNETSNDLVQPYISIYEDSSPGNWATPKEDISGSPDVGKSLCEIQGQPAVCVEARSPSDSTRSNAAYIRTVIDHTTVELSGGDDLDILQRIGNTMTPATTPTD